MSSESQDSRGQITLEFMLGTDLDAAITSLELSGTADQLQLRRLKKQKLLLKDQIAGVEDQMLPDIIA